ncbi:MAG: PQQ-binding-like beta-propeller repeat protein [Phycisphaera sp.]|nr:PQQ-binding-like beta-propeller repeat protein [Phycisphaera sp.]
MIRRTRLSLWLTAALLSTAWTGVTFAGDWAQWGGPNRDGKSDDTGLLSAWPEGGPKLAWKATGLGGGFSTPTVAGGRIYVLGTLDTDKDEHLIALDAATGQRVWATKMGQSVGGHTAPKSSPTVRDGAAYVIGSDGTLICADLTDGHVRWSKQLKSDFGGQPGGWAYAESPLLDGDTLIVTPGGDDATMAALNAKTGDVKWKCTLPADLGANRKSDGKKKPKGYSRAGYSSAIAEEVHGVRQYIQFIDGGVIGVRAADGAFLWHYDAPANPTANCSTPLYRDGAVFAASAYGNGGGRATIKRDGDTWTATEDYFVKQMQNHHGGMVLVDGYIYGTGGNSLICIDYKTGEIVWQERSVGKGSIAYADGHLYVRSEKGPVALVEANPKAYTETGRFDQPDRASEPSWAHPVIANGELYLRDWDTLLCYDVKK